MYCSLLLIRILVPEDPAPKAAVAPSVAMEVPEIATQPQYGDDSTAAAVTAGLPGLVGDSGEDDEFMNTLRMLDENMGGVRGNSRYAEPPGVTAVDTSAAAELTFGSNSSSNRQSVGINSKQALNDLQAFILRVNKRKSDAKGSAPADSSPSLKRVRVVTDSSKTGSGVASNSKQSLGDFVQFLLKHGL